MAKSYTTADFEGEGKPRYMGGGVWSSEEGLLREGEKLVEEFGALKEVVRSTRKRVGTIYEENGEQVGVLDYEEAKQSPTGGLNSKISGRWDLIDTDALTRLAAVLEYGTTRYSDDNWRLDGVQLHLKHALEHIFRYLKESREHPERRPEALKDGSVDELGHAFCRLMFALAVEMQTEEYLRLVQQNNGV